VLGGCGPVGYYTVSRVEGNLYSVNSESSLGSVYTENCFLKGAAEVTLEVEDNYFVIFDSNNSYSEETTSTPDVVTTTPKVDIYGNPKRSTTSTTYGSTYTTEYWKKSGKIRTFKDKPKQYDELIKVYSAIDLFSTFNTPEWTELCGRY